MSGNLAITGIGTVWFETTETLISIENVLFVPDLNVNLVSLIKLVNKGGRYKFENGTRVLKLGFSVISLFTVSSHLMTLRLATKLCALTQETKPTSEKEIKDKHSSLGHFSHDKMKHLKLRTDMRLNCLCNVCNATKATRNVPRRKFKNPHRHLYELLHSDICEMPIKSVDGFKYFALFVDDASRYSHLVLLTTIRSDQGSEYLSKTFQSLCISNDIQQEFSSPPCYSRGNGLCWKT